MTLRNIACVPLNDLFRDFDRDGLSMSWVYGNVGQIMRDAKIPVYGACRELHEIVDIHRLKSALESDGDINIDHLVGLLGSSLIENGIEDASKICDFLRGRRDSYDNLDHFQVIYNFKELTIDAQLPYIIPAPVTDDVKPHEWKSCSLLREFIGLEAVAFARENRLHRLHESTVLHVDLAEFQIEVSRIPDLFSLVRSKYDSEIQKLKPSLNFVTEAAEGGVTKNKGGRPRKSWWPEFNAEIGSQLYRGTLKPTSQKELKEAMEALAESRGWSHGDSTMNEPARLLWNLIKPEND